MNFIACAVAIFPRQLPEVGTDIRATVRSRDSAACWILLNLLMQLVYHDPKVFRRLAVVGSPHHVQQFLLRKWLPWSCRYEKNSIMTCVVATGLVYLFN
jgi:hypothetical protein